MDEIMTCLEINVINRNQIPVYNRRKTIDLAAACYWQFLLHMMQEETSLNLELKRGAPVEYHDHITSSHDIHDREWNVEHPV